MEDTPSCVVGSTERQGDEAGLRRPQTDRPLLHRSRYTATLGYFCMYVCTYSHTVCVYVHTLILYVCMYILSYCMCTYRTRVPRGRHWMYMELSVLMLHDARGLG